MFYTGMTSMAHMVHQMIHRAMQLKAPRRVSQTRPGNLHEYHLPSVIYPGQRVLGCLLDSANVAPEGALATFPRNDGREGAVLFEIVHLAELVDIVPRDRDSLTGLPGVTGPQGAIPDTVHGRFLS